MIDQSHSFAVLSNGAETVVTSLKEDCCQVVLVSDNHQDFARMAEEEDVTPIMSGNTKV